MLKFEVNWNSWKELGCYSANNCCLAFCFPHNIQEKSSATLGSIFLIMLWRTHLIYFVVSVAKLWNHYVFPTIGANLPLRPKINKTLKQLLMRWNPIPRPFLKYHFNHLLQDSPILFYLGCLGMKENDENFVTVLFTDGKNPWGEAHQ